MVAVAQPCGLEDALQQGARRGLAVGAGDAGHGQVAETGGRRGRPPPARGPDGPSAPRSEARRDRGGARTGPRPPRPRPLPARSRDRPGCGRARRRTELPGPTRRESIVSACTSVAGSPITVVEQAQIRPGSPPRPTPRGARRPQPGPGWIGTGRARRRRRRGAVGRRGQVRTGAAGVGTGAGPVVTARWPGGRRGGAGPRREVPAAAWVVPRPTGWHGRLALGGRGAHGRRGGQARQRRAGHLAGAGCRCAGRQWHPGAGGCFGRGGMLNACRASRAMVAKVGADAAAP